MVRQLARVEKRTREQMLAEHLTTWEAHVSAWIQERESRDKSMLIMGLIASSTDTHYGQHSISKFAVEVGDSVSMVYLYRDVYRKCAQNSNWLENLSWTHHAIAVRSRLPEAEREALLIEAADNGWSTPQLKREVGIRRVRQEMAATLPLIDPQMASAIAHWRELRPGIVKFATANPQFWAYTDDYIQDVDEALGTPWESARDFVERLIFAGYREVEFLAQKARWTKETIERLCSELVEAGTHEWRDKGGKTDDARGARPRLIVPVEEPSGDAYESYHGPRMSLLPDDEE